MFVIEDEIHAEEFGQFTTFKSAINELKSISKIPWDSYPQKCPCTSWKTCERKYQVVEYDGRQTPWKEINRTDVLTVSAKLVTWRPQFR